MGGPRMKLQEMIDEDLFRGRDLLQGLCTEFPDRYDYLLAYATSQRHLMLHFVTTNRMPEATDAFDKAREALDKLIEKAPSDPKVLLELADTLSTASSRLTGLDANQSETYLRQSLSTCQKLCEAFPSVPEYQALLATCVKIDWVCSSNRSNIGQRLSTSTSWPLIACSNCANVFERSLLSVELVANEHAHG